MRGLTTRERSILADVAHCMRYNGGLHLDRLGDRQVAGRLVKRGVLHNCACGDDDHYILTAHGIKVIELDLFANSEIDPEKLTG